MTLAERCRSIDALLLDMDGVLTDGGIVFSNQGSEIKHFFVRDGSAIKAWQKRQKQVGILSGRASDVTLQRAKDLGITTVIQDRTDKQPGFESILDHWQLTKERIAYLGDDIPDVPILKQVGLAVAVADACPEVLGVAHYVTRSPGGRGAVREAIELILRCQGHWSIG